MAVSLAAARTPSAVVRLEVFKGQRHTTLHRRTLLLQTQHKKLVVQCSIKVPTTFHFGELNNATTFLKKLPESVWKSFPEPVKEFPWKKAEDMVLQHLLHLGKKAFKWSLLVLFIVSFVSDVSSSFSSNKELMVPLGLFIGITMADFLKETSQELFQSHAKESGIGSHLVGIGSLLVFIKLMALYITLPGRTILSHVSNGGLMQVLWLARELPGSEGFVDGIPSSEPENGANEAPPSPSSQLPT